MDETDAMIVLMLIGMAVILIAMWTVFPTMLIANIVVTVGLVVWAVWLARSA